MSAARGGATIDQVRNGTHFEVGRARMTFPGKKGLSVMTYEDDEMMRGNQQVKIKSNRKGEFMSHSSSLRENSCAPFISGTQERVGSPLFAKTISKLGGMGEK